jgi:predicted thioredoxin/glutaredoxin
MTRQGCHLCDKALGILEELSLHPEVLDVDADAELYRLYDFRVPVVLVDGVIVAEGKIDRERLRKALSSS